VRVAEVITGLELGGAEMMLLRTLGALDPVRFAPEVIALRPLGPIAPRIMGLGIPVHSIGIRGALPTPAELARLWRLMRRLRPEIVHTWMYHADLLGGLVARVATRAPVIWALHNSTLDPDHVGAATRFVVRLNALLSSWMPAKIVACSRASMQVHESLGYPAEKLVLIPNGFDLTAFRPDRAAYCAVREELGIAQDVLLLGSFARFHPQKDHRTLCRAAGRIARRRGDVQFLLAGDGIEPHNTQLSAWIAETGVAERFHLLGARSDMHRLTAALDVALVSSAFGEAFPLVVGEAMACAVPCVVTDVGDAAFMVGDGGRIVPPRDPAAFANAVLELLGQSPQQRAALGQRARERIASEFELSAVVARYADLYDEVLKPSEASPQTDET